MNDLLSVKSKEVLIYEKSNLKKYIIDFLSGFKNSFVINNSNITNEYIINNSNFSKYFNIEKIFKQVVKDFNRGIGFTYNNRSIIFYETISEKEKEKIIEFQNILNKDDKISKEILNFVNTFINFSLDYNKNITKYIEHITKNKLLMLSTILLQHIYTYTIIKIDLVIQLINSLTRSILIYFSSVKLENSTIPSYNYIIKENSIILELNFYLIFMKNSNNENIIKVPFKTSSEFDIIKNEITVKFKTYINNKNELNMLYMFNSIYFYMKIDEKYHDNEFNVKMLEYLKEKFNDNKSFKNIYYLMKNVTSKNDIIKILNIINNKLDNKNINKIPIIKNETKENYEKDFFIINFNEDKKSYNSNDVSNIILKILVENPSFIIVSTQNCKTSGKDHYQHILSESLKSNDYKLLMKNNTDILRMRIYYNNSKVIFNEKGGIFSTKRPEFFKKGGYLFTFKKRNFVENLTKTSNENKNNTNTSKFYIKKYGLKESKDSKYGNGVIFMRLEISINNLFSKFIFVNINLSDNKESELKNIVNDFRLINYWKDRYNIFFPGNFNFEFNKLLYEKSEISDSVIPYNASPKNFIKKYSTNISDYKRNSTEKFMKSNNLVLFLEKLKNESRNNIYKTTFYVNLLDSIKELGIHLTYKYLENEGNKQQKFYNNISYYSAKLKNNKVQNKYIHKFLDIHDLIEKISNDKDLLNKYFEIFIELKLLDKIKLPSYNLLGRKTNSNKSEVIKTIESFINKNLINKKILNKLLLKYNINEETKKYILSSLNFLNGLKEQTDNSKKLENMKSAINEFKKNFEKNKNSIKSYIKDKDLIKLDKKCKDFLEELINKKLLKYDENNNIINSKKRNNYLEKYSEIFNSTVTPYQSSRILYILPDIIQSKGNISVQPKSILKKNNKKNILFDEIIRGSFDFDVYLFPDKSSHKLTTLSFSLLKGDIIINQTNNRSSITAVKGQNNKSNNLGIDFFIEEKKGNIRYIPENSGKNKRNNEKITNNEESKKSNTSVIPKGLVFSRVKSIEK
jgi:hypothetical protein